jgi:uncharacterized membrane protein
MQQLIKVSETFGRCCIGVAIIAFGIQHLVYADFVTRLMPKLPAWIPGHPWLACGFGIVLVIGGLAILSGKSTRAMALLLAATFLASFLVCYLPLLAAAPSHVGLWVNAGKALALSGCALLVAKTSPGKSGHFYLTPSVLSNTPEKLIPFGTLFLGGFFAFCGVLHFFYVHPVAELVPKWIPGHVFWTYFSGIALIAGGAGMNVPPTARTAAVLSALMIFLWLVLLHIPRAIADLGNSNETTAVFEALAVASAALLAAISTPTRARKRAAVESFAETQPKLHVLCNPTCAEPQSAGTQNSWVPATRKDGTYV